MTVTEVETRLSASPDNPNVLRRARVMRREPEPPVADEPPAPVERIPLGVGGFVTIQLIISIVGLGEAEDILTVPDTAYVDAIIASGWAVIYVGPGPPPPVVQPVYVHGTPTDGQSITWDNAESDWVPTTLLTAAHNLSDVLDPIASLAALGGLQKSLNLSDVPNPAAALATLGGLEASLNLSDVPNPSAALAALGGTPLGTTTPMPHLYVSGTEATVGVNGPRFQACGYNTRVLPGEYPAGMTLNTQADLDDFFSQQPAGSLHRVPAYLPGTGSGHTQASTLAILDNLVNTARRYEQRLAFRTTNWNTVGSTPGVVDQFDNKTQAFWTGQTWSIANSGSGSLESWILLLAARYASDGVLTAIDLCNEPQVSAGNAAAAAIYVSHMKAAIFAVNPGVLVYIGVNVASVVGGQAAYQTMVAAADITSAHNYQPYGYVNAADPMILAAQALGKPFWMDETGMISKGYYGLSSDATNDKDSSGRPGVPTDAQSAQVERFFRSTLALKECMGVCYYSWPATQTDGLSHYEPVPGSRTREVIRNMPIDGDEFSIETIGSVIAWYDASQNLLTQPGNAVTTLQFRHANSQLALSGPTPTSGRFAGKLPSYRFNGAQYIDQNAWKAGAATPTGYWGFAPLALPAAGSYYYFTGPQTATATASAVRINSAGQVEIIHTLAASSTAGTVVATTTNSCLTDEPNTLAYQWDTVGGAILIILNGVITVVTGATASLVSTSARIGAGFDGLNGFVGHLFEGISQSIIETRTNIFLALAYMVSRYQIHGLTGTGKTYADTIMAAEVAARTAAITAASAGTMQQPGESFATGDCWVMAGQGATPGTLLLTQAREIATPFYLPHAVSIAKLAAEVTTVGSAGALARLGIRAHDTTTGVAGALLVDGGTIDGTVLGVGSVTLGTPLALTPGWYWSTVTGQGTPTTQATVRDLAAGAVQFPVPLKAASFAALGVLANQMVFQGSVTGPLGATFTEAGFLTAGPRMMAQAA